MGGVAVEVCKWWTRTVTPSNHTLRTTTRDHASTAEHFCFTVSMEATSKVKQSTYNKANATMLIQHKQQPL